MGFAFDREVLTEAGIEEANAFAAVTSGDNSNILAARVAKDHYRVPQVVARIYDPRRAQIYQRLGIQTVATVRWTTDQILRSMIPDEVPVEYTVDNGEVVVTAMPAPVEIVGKKALQVDTPALRRVIAISRFGVRASRTATSPSRRETSFIFRQPGAIWPTWTTRSRR